MNLLDQAASRTDNADLVILAVVESLRDRDKKAVTSAVARQIRGAPFAAVAIRMEHMRHLQLLDKPDGLSYALTLMGEELLRREMSGWTPSARENRRRESVARAANGSSR